MLKLENYHDDQNDQQAAWIADFRRERSRSGNAPKLRKSISRAKAKAARKARRLNRK